jgi:methyl-accepting chemotaxis protein
VGDGVKLVAETGASLERIMKQVMEINTIVCEIAAGSTEQAVGLEQVNTAINDMDKVTQQNAAMVEESTAASHSLSTEMEKLSGLVGRFQVGSASRDDRVRRELRKVAPQAFRQEAKDASSSRSKPGLHVVQKAKLANGGAAARAESDWQEF